MTQFRMRPVGQRGSDPNQVITTNQDRRVLSMEILQDRPDSPTDPIPHHRISHRAWDCERDTCVLCGVEPGNQPDWSLS